MSTLRGFPPSSNMPKHNEADVAVRKSKRTRNETEDLNDEALSEPKLHCPAAGVDGGKKAKLKSKGRGGKKLEEVELVPESKWKGLNGVKRIMAEFQAIQSALDEGDGKIPCGAAHLHDLTFFEGEPLKVLDFEL